MAVEDLKSRMDAVERLTVLFRLERIVYLTITTLSFGVLLASAIALILRKNTGTFEQGTIELTGLFGSSGLISYSVSRVLVMWNTSIQLLGGRAKGR